MTQRIPTCRTSPRLSDSLRVPGRGHRPGRRAVAAGLMIILAGLLTLSGCETTVKKPNAAPSLSYTGPQYLRGTVGSLVHMRRGSGQPMLVSGYGLVVFPQGTNTGSSEVPSFIRQWLINEMRKRGVGSPSLAVQLPDSLKPFMSMSPEQLLASHDTAVVSVQGLIPPGASEGTRFDVLVKALPQTQTTSLAGGMLWTTDLGVDGLNPSMRFTTPLAKAHGPMYINPDHTDQAKTTANVVLSHLASTPGSDTEFRRTAVIVAGGEAVEPRRIELVLNQPSWLRSRLISDRINSRFGKTTDRQPIADPKTDLIIQVHIPERWVRRPEMLLQLISHLYVRRGPGVETQLAQRLVHVLEKQPSAANDVVWAWRSLGRMIYPVLREHYDDPKMYIRLAALEAGAWLNDERASRYLDDLSNSADPAVRAHVASALVYLPSSLQGAMTLKKLLDDPNTNVRIAAYESLASINDQSILDRYGVGDKSNLKFILDRVPAKKPLIYITQQTVPRIVIFDKNLGFKTPMLTRLWNGRLMLRATSPDQPLTIFYQLPNDPKPKTHKIYPATVSMLAYALGHSPNDRDLQDGLGLSYSQVVNVLYALCQSGDIAAPIKIYETPLVKQVQALEKQSQQRPISSVTPPVQETTNAAANPAPATTP